MLQNGEKKSKHATVYLKLLQNKCAYSFVFIRNKPSLQHHQNAYELSSKCKCIAVKFNTFCTWESPLHFHDDYIPDFHGSAGSHFNVYITGKNTINQRLSDLVNFVPEPVKIVQCIAASTWCWCHFLICHKSRDEMEVATWGFRLHRTVRSLIQFTASQSRFKELKILTGF